jgi:hypothetical protein
LPNPPPISKAVGGNSVNRERLIFDPPRMSSMINTENKGMHAMIATTQVPRLSTPLVNDRRSHKDFRRFGNSMTSGLLAMLISA